MSAESLSELQARLAAVPHLVIGLDLQSLSTPAPVELMAADIKGLLRNLASGLRQTLAIVSGRSRTELQSWIGIPDIYYVGNYGLEISGPGVLFVEPTAASSLDAMKPTAEKLRRRLQDFAGASVEDRGLTLSVRYTGDDPAKREEIRQIVHAQLANAEYPFVLTTGREAHEIRPRVYWNLGSAMLWVKERLGREDATIVFLGDAVTEEYAFAALTKEITVGIGEKPESVAHYRLENRAEVLDLLRWLANSRA